MTRENGRMAVRIGGVVIAVAALLAGLHMTARSSYLLFHSISEGFSICISVGVFLFAWNSRRFMDNNYLLFLGIASLFIGIMDGAHALAYKGMGVLSGQDPNPATQVWIASRYLFSISFLTAPVFFRRPLRVPWVFATYAVVTALSLLSIFSWHAFPDCYLPGTGLTPFKIGSEYCIILILLGALGLVISCRHSFDVRVLRLISGSIIFSIAAELAFTRYLGVYDLLNQLGHVFKIIASYLLYRTVIFTGLRSPYDLIFRSLKQNQDELGRVNLELKGLAAKQEKEIEKRKMAEDELRAHRDNLEVIVKGRTQELEERNAMLAAEVAARMKTEKDLQRSLAEAEDLYQNAPCGYHSLDPDGTFIHVNDTELAWLGYAREDLVGKLRFADIVTPPSRRIFEEIFPRFKKQGWIRDLEFEVVSRDGRIIPVLLNATAVLDGNGNYLRSRSTLFNISERKKMEEEIKKADFDWQATFDSMKDLVMVLDKDFRVERANEVAISFLGIPQDEITRSHCHTFMHRAEKPVEGCPMVKMLRTKRHEEAELFDESRQKWLAVMVDPVVNDQGDIIRTIHTVRDITERKRVEEEKKHLEAQLIQTQKMEALGRVAGGIAHDLNNMLYPILLNAQSLLNEVPADTPWYQSIQMILNAAYRQRDLVKQILSFSRHQDQNLVPMRVGPLLDDTLAFLRSSIPKTIEILQRNEARSDTILGNSTQIQQIVINLCRNAADAIEPGIGVIEVGIANVHLEQSRADPGVKAGEYVRITVKDSGCGMTREVMRQIFEPFFTTKDVGKGTGMGLAVVHGILKNHGGSVRVWSEPGKGTQFTVDLPLTDAKPGEKDHVPMPVRSAGEKKRVLLVDDEEMILKSLKRVLGLLGYEVTTAKSSQGALEMFSGDPGGFDFVITDQTMPQMTGIELSLELLKINSGIPIILCTGYSDAIDAKKVRGMGIRGLLMKPADINELRSLISHVIEPGCRDDDTSSHRAG